MDADSLRFAILSGDAKAIAKAPGVGARTAQRLILELKDKVKTEDIFRKETADIPAGPAGTGNAQKKEAVEALTALGYSSAEALKAVNGVEGAEGMDSEAIEGCGADGGGGDSESFSETSHLRRPGTGKNCDDGD